MSIHIEQTYTGGNACVFDFVIISDNACICENAQIYNNAKVYDNAKVCGDAKVYDNARVGGCMYICGDMEIFEEITSNTATSNANISNNDDFEDFIQFTLANEYYQN